MEGSEIVRLAPILFGASAMSIAALVSYAIDLRRRQTTTHVDVRTPLGARLSIDGVNLTGPVIGEIVRIVDDAQRAGPGATVKKDRLSSR